MEILKLRRSLNDSDLGQKINKSYLGIVAEGVSLWLYDCLHRLNWVIKNSDPNTGPMEMINSALEDALTELYIKGKPENRYSLTSSLWKNNTAHDGNAYMIRVPIREALDSRNK